MEKLRLQHIVLYSKGWYKKYTPKGKRKTIWDDLRILLDADGYAGFSIGDNEEQLKNRIARILVTQLERLPVKGNSRTLNHFFEEIKPYNCWKYGYYTKEYPLFRKSTEDLPYWDINEAAVRYCLSIFNNLNKDEWIPIKPDKNVLPLKNGISLKVIKEFFK